MELGAKELGRREPGRPLASSFQPPAQSKAIFTKPHFTGHTNASAAQLRVTRWQVLGLMNHTGPFQLGMFDGSVSARAPALLRFPTLTAWQVPPGEKRQISRCANIPAPVVVNHRVPRMPTSDGKVGASGLCRCLQANLRLPKTA